LKNGGWKLNKKRQKQGMKAEQKKTKTKRVFGTKPQARAGCPKRLRLGRATPRAENDVISAYLCSLPGKSLHSVNALPRIAWHFLDKIAPRIAYIYIYIYIYIYNYIYIYVRLYVYNKEQQ